MEMLSILLSGYKVVMLSLSHEQKTSLICFFTPAALFATVMCKEFLKNKFSKNG